MQLDEDVPCDNFGGKFDKIKNMKPKCTANKGPVQKKYRCNLECTNGNTNVWSVRPIKVCQQPFGETRAPGTRIDNTFTGIFSAKSRTQILTRIQNTIQLSQLNTNGSQVKSRYHYITRKTTNQKTTVLKRPSKRSISRVLTHFVTTKKNVTMSEASTI